MIKLGVKRDQPLEYKCTIRLLDDNEVLDYEFQSFHKGRYLLDYVLEKLNLVEADYFGLRFVDHHKQRHWLDTNKNILRQIKNMNPILFCFRAKFYPADPMRLREEITRYYLFLQLRRDLLHGRLYCTQADAALLGAYIIQADLGDYSEELSDTYVSDYKILLKQSSKIEEKICEIHKTLEGMTPAAAELNFLKKASTLDTYGVDPFSVKDHRGAQLYLGLNHSGVLTFQGSRRTHHFRWHEVQKLNYEGKMFIIHLVFMEDARTKRKHTVGFKCSSATACRHLWKTAVEQRLFYTMSNSHRQGIVVTGGSFFSRGSRFRYQGKCEREVLEESISIDRDPPPVVRKPLKGVGRSNSLPSTPADSDTYDTIMSRVHRPLPYIDRSASLDEEVLCGTDSQSTPEESGLNGIFPGGAYCSEATLPPLSLLEPLMEANENKSRSSSIVEGAVMGEAVKRNEELFTRPEPAGHTRDSNYEIFRNRSKRHQEASRKVHDLLQKQLSFDYDSRGPDLLLDNSSSSSETLGPPTEPLDVPLLSFSPTEQRKVVDGKRSSKINYSDSESYSNSLKRAKNQSSPRLSKKATSAKLIRQRKWIRQSFRQSSIRFMKIFAVTLSLVIIGLSILTVLIFEFDSYFEGLRSSHEIVLFRIQYYEPMKRYIFSRLSNAK